jgi:hypothetical protein
MVQKHPTPINIKTHGSNSMIENPLKTPFELGAHVAYRVAVGDWICFSSAAQTACGWQLSALMVLLKVFSAQFRHNRSLYMSVRQGKTTQTMTRQTNPTQSNPHD